MNEISNRLRALAHLWPLLIALPQAVHGESYSVGVGIGSVYSGVGVNVARHNQDSLGYVAAGCVALAEGDEKRDAACGGGVGWLKTVVQQENGKHAVGLYVGLVTAVHPSSGELEPVYGIGIPYVYFASGISQRGFNLGFAPAVGWHDGQPKVAFNLQLGMQFR